MYQRLKSSVAAALRRRLVPEPAPVLPPFPEDGLPGAGCLVRIYRDEDAEGRLALELSEGMSMWRSARARPMSTPEQALSWCRSQRLSARAGRLPVSVAIIAGVGTNRAAYAGDITIWPVVDGFGSVEVGIALLPNVRGHAVATPASRAFLRWIAEAPGLHRVETVHSVRNRVACILADRNGLVREGTKREALPLLEDDGQTVWHDVCIHAGLTSDLRRDLAVAESAGA